MNKSASRRKLRQWGTGRIRRQEFICTAREYAQVRNTGQTTAGRYMVMGYLDAPDDTTRLGIIVSKRYNKRAVQRNRARRLIREAFRLSRPKIEGAIWLVMIARHHLHGVKAQDVQAEMLKLLRRIDRLKPEAEEVH